MPSHRLVVDPSFVSPGFAFIHYEENEQGEKAAIYALQSMTQNQFEPSPHLDRGAVVQAPSLISPSNPMKYVHHLQQSFSPRQGAGHHAPQTASPNNNTQQHVLGGIPVKYSFGKRQIFSRHRRASENAAAAAAALAASQVMQSNMAMMMQGMMGANVGSGRSSGRGFARGGHNAGPMSYPPQVIPPNPVFNSQFMQFMQPTQSHMHEPHHHAPPQQDVIPSRYTKAHHPSYMSGPTSVSHSPSEVSQSPAQAAAAAQAQAQAAAATSWMIQSLAAQQYGQGMAPLSVQQIQQAYQQIQQQAAAQAAQAAQAVQAAHQQQQQQHHHHHQQLHHASHSHHQHHSPVRSAPSSHHSHSSVVSHYPSDSHSAPPSSITSGVSDMNEATSNLASAAAKFFDAQSQIYLQQQQQQHAPAMESHSHSHLHSSSHAHSHSLLSDSSSISHLSSGSMSHLMSDIGYVGAPASHHTQSHSMSHLDSAPTNQQQTFYQSHSAHGHGHHVHQLTSR